MGACIQAEVVLPMVNGRIMGGQNHGRPKQRADQFALLHSALIILPPIILPTPGERDKRSAAWQECVAQLLIAAQCVKTARSGQGAIG